MTDEQKDALMTLKVFRNWLRLQTISAVSIHFSDKTYEQRQLLKELYDDYDEDDHSTRVIVKKAFGEYPFRRIRWFMFDDWFNFSETERVEFLHQKGIEHGSVSSEYSAWKDFCVQTANEQFKQVDEEIGAFIKRMNDKGVNFNTMDIPELNPCPFCGNKPTVLRSALTENAISISCNEHKGTLIVATAYMESEKAIKAWNTRFMEGDSGEREQ